MKNRARMSVVLLLTLALSELAAAQTEKANLKVDWTKVIRESKTTPTLQVVVNPPLRPGSPIREPAYKALKDLKADYVRYVPWFPYPKLGVAELKPPENGKTSWDFSLIDPMIIDFLKATEGHPVVINFSTIPQWMWKTPQKVPYPDDPNQVTWTYQQGTELRDPSMKELGDYFARLIGWYTKGGFVDEFGKRHDSGHHFKISHWEVLNEIDLEHNIDNKMYTAMYDAIVESIRRVNPDIKFVGLSLAKTTRAGAPFEYFLDPKNHKPGIPLDYISYHFYAIPTPDQTTAIEQYTFFDGADRFLSEVRFIEGIRQRLSPSTGTMLNELGAISAEDLGQGNPGFKFKPIDNAYWNLTAAMYAYLYGQLAMIGIDVAGESQLVGFPTQFPSVTMVDWETGRPNARFWTLKLLRDNFGPGDKLVETLVTVPAQGEAPHPYVYAQGFLTRDGKQKILLVNKRDRTFEVSLPAANSRAEVVDQTTASNPAVSSPVVDHKLAIKGFAVAVVTLAQ